jgi:predicted nucleic acid-binding protein
MQKAIFDTSIWIDLFRNVTSIQTDLLLTYISEDSEKVYLTPTIIQEVIQGVKTEKDFNEKLEVLLDFNSFLDDWTEISISAAKLFFDLKKKGITIRKSNDCLIAAVAIKHNVLLVHNDSDFELIAQGSDLKTLKP